MYRFVPDFHSYVFAKYYLNWFTVYHKNKKGKLFIETQCRMQITQHIKNMLAHFAACKSSFCVFSLVTFSFDNVFLKFVQHFSK